MLAARSSPSPAKAADRRLHQRVKVNLLGRCMFEDRREFTCGLSPKTLQCLGVHGNAVCNLAKLGAKAFGNDLEVPPSLFVIFCGHSDPSSDPRQYIVPLPGEVRGGRA